MLQGTFYEVEDIETGPGSTIRGHLVLNAGHEIFRGHFPGVPVVPGVCMMQMVKEILEKALAMPMRLVNAESLKFLQVINPREYSRVGFQIQYQLLPTRQVTVQADLMAGETVCFRMKAVMTSHP